MKHISLLFFSSFLVLINLIPACAADDIRLSGVRPPAVSGQFYPADPKKLDQTIRQYLDESKPIPMKDPIAILVPHAGYLYSGQILADAYRQIEGRQYDVFVILGVNHTTADFSGVSLADYESFRTPLGDAQVDRTVTDALMAECSDCVLSRDVHIKEHSIEVQLPFLQTLFPKAKIVPIIIHPPDFDMCSRFGTALARVLKNRKALIIISSDLSHYPAASDAAKADSKTLTTIAGMDPKQIASVMHVLDVPNLETRACGEAAILSGIIAARILGAERAIIAGYANSGNVTLGDRTSCVGYGAVAFVAGKEPNDLHLLDRTELSASATPLTDSEKKLLLEFSRKTLQQFLTTETLPLLRPDSSRFKFSQGAFVTLKKDNQLRGCIGSILPEDELGRTVGKMTLYAALKDPRFQPVKPDELKHIEIEISVLSPLKQIDDPAQIVIGRDGVLLIKEGASAVFLPQVAPEQNWNRTEMLGNLCLKAGLATNCWEKDVTLQTFQADVFSESQ